jgi:membrane-associated phospholipid phosphatase
MVYRLMAVCQTRRPRARTNLPDSREVWGARGAGTASLVTDIGVALSERPGGKHDDPADKDEPRPLERLEAFPPVVAGVLTLVIGYVALVVATIAVGLLLVEVILTGWVQRADNDVNHWFAERRTAFETDVSWVGSHLAETGTVIVVIAAVALLLLFRHRFLAALFLVVAITVEAATYMATVVVIDRPRPHVVRLDDLGTGRSYPSGHTAAAVVVYVGIAMIVLRYVRNRAARWAAVVIAVIGPIAVAVARVYRGMHHPIDVIAGALVGLGGLYVGFMVARVVGEAYARRRAAGTS